MVADFVRRYGEYGLDRNAHATAGSEKMCDTRSI